MRTRRIAGLFVAFACLLVAAPVDAQGLGLGRRLDRPLPHATERGERAEADGATNQASPDGEAPWAGPQIALHYEHFKLSDGWGAGDAHTGGVEVFLQWPLSELRTGLLVEMGSRSTQRSGDDLVVRGAINLGFQLTELLDPLVPFVSAVVSFGGVVGQRFETTVAHAFGGGGIELGASLRVFRNFHLDATFGYLRLEMDGASFDVFLVRLGLGL